MWREQIRIVWGRLNSSLSHKSPWGSQGAEGEWNEYKMLIAKEETNEVEQLIKRRWKIGP